MHDCRKFREDWVASPPELRKVAFDCEDCGRFCSESIALLAALDAANPVVPEDACGYWTEFDARLKACIVREGAVKASRRIYRRSAVPVAAAAAFVAAVTLGMLQVLPETQSPPGPALVGRVEVVDDHIEGLDPHVVTYLGQSELFLRAFTKIGPSNREDIEDARLRASRKLAGIAVQKNAAGNFAPVVIALDEYESVLRDIKNLGSPEEIADIQERIERNGLIASLKAYQPRVILMSQR